jgi:hypothetical protein
MKIVRIIGNVFVNGLPAEVGMDVLPEDLLDARDAEVEFENGAVLINISANFGYLIGIRNVAEIPSTPTVQAVEFTSPITTSEGLVINPPIELTTQPTEDLAL